MALVSAAAKPNSTPETAPSSAARSDRRTRSEISTAGMHTTAAMPPAISQLRTGASFFPPDGSISARKPTSPPVTRIAPATSRRPTRWPVRRAPSGSAKTTLTTWIGCTTIRRPRPSATACIANPTSSITTPASHSGRFISRAMKPAASSDPLRLLHAALLLQNRAQRVHEGRAEREQDGCHARRTVSRYPCACGRSATSGRTAIKILYGAIGEGLGHATRSRVVAEHLLEQGHEVKMAASGPGATRTCEQHLPDVEEIWGS